MNGGGEKTQQERSAEDNLGMRGIDDAGNDFGVKKAEEERGNGKDETDKRAGGADVEESASGANRGTDHDESAEGANERREGNEEGIARVDVMVPTSEEVAEFVGEENSQEGSRERHASEKACGIFVKESESGEKIVERNGLIVSVGDGELRAGDETGAKC